LCPVYTRNEIDCVIITTLLDYLSRTVYASVHTIFAHYYLSWPVVNLSI